MSTLPVFVGATLLIAASPGPNTFFIISTALSRGLSASAVATIGLVLASLVYLTLTVTGLSALTATLPIVFDAVQAAGVAYLVYLGIRMIAAAGRRDAPGPTPASARSLVLQGFVTSFSNPKAIVYWSAFLPQFVDTARPAAPQLVMLGLIGTMLEVPVLLCYAAIAARSRERFVPKPLVTAIDRFAGVYFIAMGVYFAALIVQRLM